jgi:hypothetical protein
MQTNNITRQVWGHGSTLTPAQHQTLLLENGQPEGERSSLQIALETLGLWDRWNKEEQPRSQEWFLSNVKPS